MRRISTANAVESLKEASGKVERRMYELMNVIDAKDAIIEKLTVENRRMKEELKCSSRD